MTEKKSLPAKLLVFDLDGTLINSIGAIAYHLNQMLKNYDLAPISTERVRQLVGNSSRYLVYHSLEESGGEGWTEEGKETFLAAYNQAYLEEPLVRTELYPGIADLLKELKKAGYKLAVLSNKPDAIVKSICAKLFPEGLFDRVLGFVEDIPRKPDPAGLILIMEELGAKQTETIYIGDSEVDADLGNRAQLDTLLVSYGFRPGSELKSLKYRWLADSVTDLERILLQA